MNTGENIYVAVSADGKLQPVGRDISIDGSGWKAPAEKPEIFKSRVTVHGTMRLGSTEMVVLPAGVIPDWVLGQDGSPTGIKFTEPLVTRVFHEGDEIFAFAEGLPVDEVGKIIGVDLMVPAPGYVVEISSISVKLLTPDERDERRFRAKVAFLMLGAKHTPGPWYMNSALYPTEVSIEAREPRPTKHDPDNYSFSEIAGTIENQFDPKTTMANAVLIMAAPDLLYALQGLLSACNRLNGPGPGLGELIGARLAIEKALGIQS